MTAHRQPEKPNPYSLRSLQEAGKLRPYDATETEQWLARRAELRKLCDGSTELAVKLKAQRDLESGR